MRTTTRSVLVAVVRWLLLAAGVTLTTVAFVHLVEVNDRIAHASPWWWVGLIGVAATMLALGSPWPRRSDASRRTGS